MTFNARQPTTCIRKKLHIERFPDSALPYTAVAVIFKSKFPSSRITRACQCPQLEKLEKLMVLLGIELGYPAVMTSALALSCLTAPDKFGNSVVLICLCILKGLPPESESGNQIKVWVEAM